MSQKRARRQRQAARAHVDAFIRYCDEWADQLPEHEKQRFWAGELDPWEREDWHPPMPEDFR